MDTCATLEVFSHKKVSPLDTVTQRALHIADIRMTSAEPWQTISPSHILAHTHRV